MMITDYYPFGMPMPDRRITDANAYRYAYQGQEKDPETGKEAFELRLWDGRIGRWLTTDPAGVGFSPYMGMNNNPISEIDPDGACPCSECPELCNQGDTYGYTQAPVDLGSVASNSIDPRGFDADFPTWTSSFDGNLADWNVAMGTNFKDHYAAYDYWNKQQMQSEKNAFMSDFSRRREAMGKGAMSMIAVGVSPIFIGAAPISLTAGEASGIFYNGLARVILRTNIMNGSVVAGSGTTVLLGRQMSVIAKDAQKYNYVYLQMPKLATPLRGLRLPYNRLWIRYHLSSGSGIQFHINTRIVQPASRYMEMEINEVNKFLGF